MQPVTIGIDVGSVAVSLAIIDGKRRWIGGGYAFHHGRVGASLTELLAPLDLSCGALVALTGSVPAGINAHLHCDTLVALITGACHHHPQARAILHVGGERFGLVRLDTDASFAGYQTNSTCAAGTGGFLDQQARRLNLADAEALGRLALDNSGPIPKIATRCAVFAKTDLVHAQQEGFSLAQICDGLCQGVARHIVDSLFGGQPVGEPILFAGGVARNQAVVGHIRRLIDQTLFCQAHPIGAAGAALCLAEKRIDSASAFRSVADIVSPVPRPKVHAFAPLELQRSVYPDFGGTKAWCFAQAPASTANPVEVDIYQWPSGPAITAMVGIDVGSTSTKLALVTNKGTVAAGFYTRTAGNPVQALRQLLAALETACTGQSASLAINGCAVTGSGRKLAGAIIGADLVLDEITAHARAACDLNPAVDTIIEIGGQDSKFTTLKDGRVTFCVMNTVCAAGTGSFIEEQAQKLDCPLADYAGRVMHKSAPMASDRCTVFMERDINHHLAEGYDREEVLATVMHSITENYLRKVAVEKHIGQVICFQGATAKNKALVAAFEQRLQKPIHVSRFCHLTGAIGAALALADQGCAATAFRGVGLWRQPIPMRMETCTLCANHCKITVADVAGTTVASGFLCGRHYNDTGPTDQDRSGFNLLRQRQMAWGGIKTPVSAAGPVIGLPAALHLMDDLAFWQAFFAELGIATITSQARRDPPRSGKALAGAEFCAPMVALHADAAFLMQKADYVFLPFYLEQRTGHKHLRRQYCYYTQYAPALVAQSSGAEAGRVLTPLVHYLYGSLHTQAQLYRMFKSIPGCRVAFSDLRRALEKADRFKSAAIGRLRQCYRELTAQAKAIHVVLLGRPYTVLSRRMNKGIPSIFGALGVKAFFQDMLSVTKAGVADLEMLLGKIHWHYAATILEAARITATTSGAYPVLITSFRCTPDAFLIGCFKTLMEAHAKPYLILQLDEHGSSVGYETRIEAAVRSFQNHFATCAPKVPLYPATFFPRQASAIDGKTLILPCWDRLSQRLVVANLKREGIDARLLSDTPERIRRSLRHNSGQCIPVNIVAENFIDCITEQGLDPERCLLWIVPSTIACNLPMYAYFIQNLLWERGGGFEKARVFSSSLSFAEVSLKLPINTYMAYMLGGMIRKIGCRLRPYETVRGATNQAIEASIRMLEAAFAGEGDKEAAVARVAAILAAVPIAGDRSPRPKVAISGDLYVRDNEVVNQGLIGLIEDSGGQVVTTPYSAYVKMIARPYLRKWFVEGAYLEALSSGALIAAVTHLEKKYFRHLAPLVDDPAPVFDTPVKQVLAAFGLRQEHTGESMENLLKIHYTLKYHPDLALFVQANPAFCCPAMVTEAMSAGIERATGVPVVDVTYDGIGGSKNDLLIAYLKYPRAVKKPSWRIR